MKKTIITIIILVLVLAAVAGALMLINKLFYAAERDVIVTSDFVALGGTKKISLDIDIGYINVTERPSGENVTLEFAAIRDDFYHIEASADAINITSDELKWYDRARLSVADKYGVTVGIPADFDGVILLDTMAGNIIISNIEAGEITAHTVTGNVTATSIIADALGLVADTGNVELSDIDAPNVSASVGTGNVDFVEISSESLLNASFGAHIGNITGSFSLPRESCAVTVTHGTGECNVESGGDGIPVSFSVDVGNINVTFDD